MRKNKVTNILLYSDFNIHHTFISWHQGLYPSIEVISVKCRQPGSERLLCTAVSCRSLAASYFLRGPKKWRSLCARLGL